MTDHLKLPTPICDFCNGKPVTVGYRCGAQHSMTIESKNGDTFLSTSSGDWASCAICDQTVSLIRDGYTKLLPNTLRGILCTFAVDVLLRQNLLDGPPEVNNRLITIASDWFAMVIPTLGERYLDFPTGPTIAEGEGPGIKEYFDTLADSVAKREPNT